MYIEIIRGISKNNKYTKWYCLICSNALLNRPKNKADAIDIYGYVEGHHILPKSFNIGGATDKDNIVFLTPREHFMCHYLLTKMSIGENKVKMDYAFTCFNANSLRKLSKKYSLLVKSKKVFCDEARKANISQSRLKTKKLHCEFCNKSCDPGNFKQYHGDNCKLNPDIKMSSLMKRKEKAKKSKKTLIENNNGEDPFLLKSIQRQDKVKLVCPHCLKEGYNYGNMYLHHFDRCPQNITDSRIYTNKYTMHDVYCIGCHTKTNSGNLKLHHNNC